jgi:hypothetical protein
MSIELKIKIKNLADEARTIRTEENKLHGMAKWSLQHHRKTVVRDAARRAQIAQAIIRDRDWSDPASSEELTRYGDWKEIARMVRKYGTAETVNSLPAIEKAFKSFSVWRPRYAEDACSNAA